MLPAAIEMTTRAHGRPPLVVVAALPPRGLEPEEKAPNNPPAASGQGTMQ